MIIKASSYLITMYTFVYTHGSSSYNWLEQSRKGKVIGSSPIGSTNFLLVDEACWHNFRLRQKNKNCQVKRLVSTIASVETNYKLQLAYSVCSIV